MIWPLIVNMCAYKDYYYYYSLFSKWPSIVDMYRILSLFLFLIILIDLGLFDFFIFSFCTMELPMWDALPENVKITSTVGILKNKQLFCPLPTQPHLAILRNVASQEKAKKPTYAQRWRLTISWDDHFLFTHKMLDFKTLLLGRWPSLIPLYYVSSPCPQM